MSNDYKNSLQDEKRYVAVIEFYIWAKNDEEAIDKVKKECKENDDKKDNKCELIKIVQQSFGTLGNRPVYGR